MGFTADKLADCTLFNAMLGRGREKLAEFTEAKMPKCASCGKDYSIWNAALGEGVCAECSRAQKQARDKQKQARDKEWEESLQQEKVQAARERAEEAVRQPQTKYPALRVVVGIYYLLAWLVGIAAAVASIAAFSHQQLAYAVVCVLVGFLVVVSCVAAAELIKVFLDTEENTRNCYSALWQMSNKQ